MDPATMSMIMGVLDKAKADDKRLEQKGREGLNTAANVGSFAGDLLVASANRPDDQPDVKGAIKGGALSGASKGFQSGGIFGALAGAIGGAGVAGLSTAQNRQDFEETKKIDFEQMMNDSTSLPFVGYAEEGGISGLEVDVELAPVQAEKGENVMLGDFSITDVKADKSHEEMESSDVTDILPKGSVIFSNDEGSEIRRDDIEDEMNLIAYKPIYYEDGDNSKTGRTERVLFTDLYKDDEDSLSPAELAKRIKKKYPTSDNEKDIFTNETNRQNKESRAAYLGRLIRLQEGNKIEKGKPSMEQEYVPSFAAGGTVGSEPPVSSENMPILKSVLKDEYGLEIGDVDRETLRIINSQINKQKGNRGGVDLKTLVSGVVSMDEISSPVGRAMRSKQNNTSQVSERLSGVQQVSPGEDRFQYVTLDPTDPYGRGPKMPSSPTAAVRGGRTTTPLEMLDKDGINQYVESINQNPERLIKDVADGKVSKSDLNKLKALGDPDINRRIDETYAKLGDRLDRLDAQNRNNKIKQLRRSGDAFRRKRGLNALRFGSAAAGTLMQSNREDPALKQTGDLSEMYADTPESIIAEQENQARASIAARANQLENMGASASQIANSQAAAQFEVQKTVNRIRSQFEMQRANNRSSRAQVRQNVQNYNNEKITQARNAERTNQNQAIADLFGAQGNYFERAERIGDQELGYENAIDREYNTNEQNMFQNRLNAESSELNTDINAANLDKRHQSLQDFINYQKNNPTPNPDIPVEKIGKSDLDRGDDMNRGSYYDPFARVSRPIQQPPLIEPQISLPPILEDRRVPEINVEPILPIPENLQEEDEEPFGQIEGSI